MRPVAPLTPYNQGAQIQDVVQSLQLKRFLSSITHAIGKFCLFALIIASFFVNRNFILSLHTSLVPQNLIINVF